MLLTEPVDDGGDVNLIGFVIAGKRVHHPVDAEPIGHLPLAFAPWYDRGHRAAQAVDCPGAGPVIGADNHGGNPVIVASATAFDPDGPASPSAGEIVEQVKRLCQDMVLGRVCKCRYVETAHKPAQMKSRGTDATGSVRCETAALPRVEQNSATGFQVLVQFAADLICQERLTWRYRPIKQRKERQFICFNPYGYRVCRFNGGAPPQNIAQPLKAGFGRIIQRAIPRKDECKPGFQCCCKRDSIRAGRRSC